MRAMLEWRGVPQGQARRWRDRSSLAWPKALVALFAKQLAQHVGHGAGLGQFGLGL